MRRALAVAAIAVVGLIVVVLAWRLLAGRAASPEPTAAVPAMAPATATAPASSTGAAAPAATEEPPAAPAGVLPAPALFPVAWDDRGDFAAGLVSGAQGVLGELPGATVYHLDLTLDDSLTQLQGRQEMHVTNREEIPLEEMVLRLFPNLMGGRAVVENVQVNGAPVTPAYELQDSVLRVPLPAPLAPGESLVLSFDFDVTIPRSGGGHYGTFIYDEEILALAHFYPLLAVYDDEGWNVELPPEGGDIVYSESSFYRARLTAPAGVVLAASGVEATREEQGDRQIVTYLAGPVRDFYIAGSARYERTSATVGETTLHSYTFPEYADVGEQVLAYAVAAVESYEAHFGPYPFTELDLGSTPTAALGVEYPGIVVNALRLYERQNPFPPQVLESTTAHEVAHQWFYSIVGNDQLDEPWLDESLAQYATLLYFADQYGAGGARGFRDSLVGRWQSIEMAELPVGLPVAEYSPQEYSAIVYGRGGLFFEALEAEMGEDDFAAFLRAYYESQQWGVATTESLRSVAEASCECDLGALFADWIYPEGQDEGVTDVEGEDRG
ncbi:MAG: M1 family metallopeptidase [Chloroflexi bacterium]|nr:M1 family metallopeptidase [Chloroflexota bacterium]